RVRLDEWALTGVACDGNQSIERFGTAGAARSECVSSFDESRAFAVRPPLLECGDGPRRGFVLVTLGACVRNPECDGILGSRKTDGVIAHRRFDADHGLRHVTVDAGAAGAVGAMACMRGQPR